MKKLVFGLLMSMFMIFPIGVFAEGGISASPTSISVEVGQTKTFKITAYNAIGDVSIFSNDTSIASVDTSEWGTGMVDSGQTKDVDITVTGVHIGTTTITLKVDGATFDSEPLENDITITVNVTSASGPPPGGNPVNPTPGGTPVNPSNGGNNNNNNSSNNTNTDKKEEKKDEKKEEKKSNNTKLKELTVSNYDLKKISDNKYEVTVQNKVTIVSVTAVTEDSKATVKGTGMHELAVGDNKIELVVTAEDGSTNKITITVTREEAEATADTDTVDTTGSDEEEPVNNINIISIIMIGLNIILGIAVITLFIKNKKLKESINK